MKLALWVTSGFAIVGLTFWWAATSGVLANPVPVSLFAMCCLASNLGSFWMIYVAIRHERHPWPMILLAFLPFAAFWYYFERVRFDKHAWRRTEGDN